MQIFCTSKALTKNKRRAWGLNVRSAETKGTGPWYTAMLFQNTIDFDFSPKIGKDMTKHKKVVWGGG
jgi:hypothetical protein